jgi:hypothetical protein
MAQSDYANLADALAAAGAGFTAAGAHLTTAGAGVTTVSQEYARLPIVSAIRDNQTLIDLINQKHDQTAQQINTLRTDITADITTLRTGITTLRTDITTLQANMMNRLDAMSYFLCSYF